MGELCRNLWRKIRILLSHRSSLMSGVGEESRQFRKLKYRVGFWVALINLSSQVKLYEAAHQPIVSAGV
jgi:hypothetical protein